MTDTADNTSEDRDGAAALDLLLTTAAQSQWRRLVPGKGALRFVGALAARPDAVAEHAVDLATEIGRIVVGRSDIAPDPRDRRFSDPAWSDNPVLRALLRAYLTLDGNVRGLSSELPLDWRDRARADFVVGNLLDAIAPSNFPGVNPLSVEAAVGTRGLSIVRGARNFVRDYAHKPRVPKMIDAQAFRVGTDLAASEGAVVLATDTFELIHYRPATESVHHTPLLIVPPLINKYYIVDLAPGRSIVEYLIGEGHQVFALSWRNPTAAHRDWGLDHYAGQLLRALDSVEEITGSRRTHTMSLCSGGTLMTMLAARMCATDRAERIASIGLAVNVLDQSKAGLTAAVPDASMQTATKMSSVKGYLDGASLTEMFAWMRANDLVWSYWVNNYLQGRDPKPFDVLFWNADSTRLTAALHREFVDLFSSNALTRPGEAQLLGGPVDLATIGADSYIVAGVADHISRWQSAYRSVHLLGGDTRFVLSTSGHIACLVNPPTNAKATLRINTANPVSADEWLAGSEIVPGSWWPDYAGWLAKRSDGEKPAPATLGSAAHPASTRAPGRYVYAK